MRLNFTLEPDLIAQFLELLKTPHVAFTLFGLAIAWVLNTYLRRKDKQ